VTFYTQFSLHRTVALPYCFCGISYPEILTGSLWAEASNNGG